MIKLTYLTLFPELIDSYFQEGLLSRAEKKQIFEKKIIQLRDFSKNKYKSIDGKSYGGGDGMVFCPEPIRDAIDLAKKDFDQQKKNKVILLSPQGKVCDQNLLSELSTYDHLVFICGRYAGFDQRISFLCDLEVSIGDYVLSGGELPALVLTEGLMRHRDGFLGNAESLTNDSFSIKETRHIKLLEAPQFTEPTEFNGLRVPAVLQSGHHQKIADWKSKLSVLITLKKRPDLLLGKYRNSDDPSAKGLLEFYQQMSQEEKSLLGIENLDSKIQEFLK